MMRIQPRFAPGRALACAALACALFAALPASAEDDAAAARTVTVRGTGSVAAAPDRAELLVGVITHAESASEALNANSAAMGRVMKTLEGFGVAAKDIRTRALSLTPLYDSARGPGPRRGDAGAPRIAGYRASNGVSATVRAIPTLGRMIDALVGEGANRLDGVRFLIGETAALGDEARRRAVADARRKAALYAEAAGARLGRVLSVAETGVVLPRPTMLRAAAMASASAVPLAPGQQTVTANVTVTYALE